MNTLVPISLKKLTYTVSRRASVVSVETNSVYAGSTHHVLASNTDSATLRPPGAAYSFTDRLSRRFGNGLSLSLNYLPSKFSGSSNARFRSAPVHSPTGMHSSKRDNADRVNDLRMPAPETLRWNKFKWVLLITNSIVSFVYFP